MPRFRIRDGRVERLNSEGDVVPSGNDAQPPAALPDGWRGVLAVEEELTGDDRMFAAEALRLDEVSGVLPLDWARERREGHDGAVTIGTIDRAWREGSQVWGEGRFDLGSEEGREAARRVGDGQALAPSVDLDRVDVEVQVVSRLLADEGFILADEVAVEESVEQETPEPVDVGDGEEREVVFEWSPGDEVLVVRSAELRGATLVSIPAFTSTTIEPVYGYVLPASDSGGEDTDEAVAASSAVDTLPSRAWFDDPRLDEPTPLTVEPSGRVFGHIATWGTCHTGMPGACVEPPQSSSGYAYFHTGEVDTDLGEPVAVGRLTVDTTHAGRRLGATDTVAHYEHSGNAVAFVRAGEDRYGIWVAGSVSPRATSEQVATLRAHPPSGDWRRIGGSLELVAVLAVNSPGFPVPRARALVAGGSVQSLQRSAVDVEHAPATPQGRRSDAESALLARLATREAREVAGRVRATAAARLVERVGQYGCNCGGRRIDPATGRRTSGRQVADGNDGRGWEYVAPDGETTHFTIRHGAQLEVMRRGGVGTVRPAS